MIRSLRTFAEDPQRLSIGLLFGILSILFSSWVTRLPEIQLNLEMSESQVGFSLLGMSLGALIITPLSALLLLRSQIRRASLHSSLLYCLSFLLPVFAYNFHWLFIAMVIVGLAQGYMQFVINAAAAAVEEEQNQHIMASCHGMFSVGGIIGAGSTSILANWGVGALEHMTVLCLLMMVLTWVLKPWLNQLPDTSSSTSNLALPGRPVLGIVLISFLIMMAEGIVLDWSSIYLKNSLNSSVLLSGLGFTGFSLTMAIGRLYGSELIARWGAKNLVRGGSMIGVIGLSLAAGFTHPYIAIAGFSLVGLGFSCIAPILFSASARTPGVHPSSGIAAISTAIILGFLVGRPLVGIIAEYHSLAASMWMAAGVTLLAGLISWKVKIR